MATQHPSVALSTCQACSIKPLEQPGLEKPKIVPARVKPSDPITIKTASFLKLVAEC